MVLATVNATRAAENVRSYPQVSTRVVLLKDFGEAGFIFFTNYNSRKAREIASTPYGSLLFYWAPLQRQVRIEGLLKKIPRAQSEAYFATRSRESQLGAHASPQSVRLASRAELDKHYTLVHAKYSAAKEVPCPEHWGGYVLRPQYIEFWQGQAHRLHDRLAYHYKDDCQQWEEPQRLAP